MRQKSGVWGRSGNRGSRSGSEVMTVNLPAGPDNPFRPGVGRGLSRAASPGPSKSRSRSAKQSAGGVTYRHRWSLSFCEEHSWICEGAGSSTVAVHHLTGAESEITDCLARYLPVGLEGVAAAQAQGLIAALGGPGGSREQGPVEEVTRSGFRAVREMALEHRPSVRVRSRRECPVCRSGPTSFSGTPWPCRVWNSALAIGVVSAQDVTPAAV